MLPPLPRCSSWVYSSLVSPNRINLPRKGCRVGLHIVLFEDCSAFTHVAACTLAQSPNRDTLIEGFSHFVTSMTAPIASGWSESPGGACTHRKAPPCHGAHPLPTLSLRGGNGSCCPICDVRRAALEWCHGKEDYSAGYRSRHFSAWLTEVHVDLYCEQIRPDRLSRWPQTPDQCDAPHDRRKPSIIAALAQKPDESWFPQSASPVQRRRSLRTFLLRGYSR
jgi:hypothetical protein